MPNKNSKFSFPPSEISWAAIEFERRPHGLFGQFFVFFITGLVLTSLVYSLVGKMPVTVEAEGRLTSMDPPVPIRAAQKITVSKLLVHENDRVKQGAVLLTSIENLSETDRRLLESYSKKLAELNSRNDYLKCGNCLAELKAQSDVYLKIQSQADLINVISPVQDQVRELIVSLEERRTLEPTFADSRLNIRRDTEKLTMIHNKKADKILSQEVDGLTADLAQNKAKIDERYQRSSQRILAAHDQLESRLIEFKNKLSYMAQQYTIHAPFDGTVISLEVKGAGEVLAVGQQLMLLIPKDSPIVAELSIQNKDLSDVNASIDAQIKVDALPEFDYGTATGKVIEVNRKERDIASEKERTSVTTPNFVARIRLNQQELKKDGRAEALVPGMTVKGVIRMRDESIFHIIVRALFQLKEGNKGSA